MNQQVRKRQGLLRKFFQRAFSFLKRRPRNPQEVRHLPLEILAMIVRQAFVDGSAEWTNTEQGESGIKRGLWALCWVNRFFRDEARKGLFQRVVIRYSHMRADAEFLCELAGNIREIKFVFDLLQVPPDFSKEFIRLAGEYRLFAWEAIPALRRLFEAAGLIGNLQCISVEIDDRARRDFYLSKGIYVALHGAFSAVVLPHLETLIIYDKDIINAAALWEPSHGNRRLAQRHWRDYPGYHDYSDALVQNWRNLTTFIYVYRGDYPRSSGPQIPALLDWISQMANLHHLALEGLECNDLPNTTLEGLRTPWLRTLQLHNIRLASPLSKLLHSVRNDPLRIISLRDYAIYQSVDQWHTIFLACGEIAALRVLRLDRLTYADHDLEYCLSTQLCTPFEEDKAALRLLAEILTRQWGEEEEEYEIGWNICTGRHDGISERVPPVTVAGRGIR